MRSQYGAVAGADGPMQHPTEDPLKIEHLDELERGPGTKQRSAVTGDGGDAAVGTGVSGGVEGGGIKPETIAGTSEVVFFFWGEEAAAVGLRAAPFLRGIERDPEVGCAADGDDLFQEGEGTGRSGPGLVRGVGGRVSYEADCVGERGVLGGGCGVKDWEAVGRVQEGVEVMGG